MSPKWWLARSCSPLRGTERSDRSRAAAEVPSPSPAPPHPANGTSARAALRTRPGALVVRVKRVGLPVSARIRGREACPSLLEECRVVVLAISDVTQARQWRARSPMHPSSSQAAWNGHSSNTMEANFARKVRTTAPAPPPRRRRTHRRVPSRTPGVGHPAVEPKPPPFAHDAPTDASWIARERRMVPRGGALSRTRSGGDFRFRNRPPRRSDGAEGHGHPSLRADEAGRTRRSERRFAPVRF